MTASAVELEEIDGDKRAEYIERSHVWEPGNPAQRDILAGPRTKGSPKGSELICTYIEPKEEQLEGAAAKFLCKTDDNQVWRVKFGQDNPEIYAEPVATRLFWALGFYADEVYPMRVRCRKCPEKDPSKPTKEEARVERVISDATAEKTFRGVVIEESEDQGWKWTELQKVSPEKGGAPRSHIDALKLLSVFVQHADSKPDNQRLACYPEDINDADGDGKGACAKPFLMVQDLGGTFGSGTEIIAVSKMDFEGWRDQEIWNRAKEADFLVKNKQPICYGKITASELAGAEGLNDPAISEEGRKFLADLLNQLTEKQILDLFRIAGVDRREEYIEEDGQKRRVTANDWAAVFMKKRAEISKRECPIVRD